MCPSELNENCPFSVLESQDLHTPVVGSRIGGIPELIRDKENGRLFDAKDVAGLKTIVEELWNNVDEVKKYQNACATLEYDGIDEYCNKLLGYYE